MLHRCATEGSNLGQVRSVPCSAANGHCIAVVLSGALTSPMCSTKPECHVSVVSDRARERATHGGADCAADRKGVRCVGLNPVQCVEVALVGVWMEVFLGGRNLGVDPMRSMMDLRSAPPASNQEAWAWRRSWTRTWQSTPLF